MLTNQPKIMRNTIRGCH